MSAAIPTVFPIKRCSGALIRGTAATRGSVVRSLIYAGRLYSRRTVDVRARLLAFRRVNGRMVETVVHGRTVDLSRSGAGLMVTRELSAGAEVMLSLVLPGADGPLCLRAKVVRRRGFTAGLEFVQPTAEQRLLLLEFCGR